MSARTAACPSFRRHAVSLSSLLALACLSLVTSGALIASGAVSVPSDAGRSEHVRAGAAGRFHAAALGSAVPVGPGEATGPDEEMLLGSIFGSSVVTQMRAAERRTHDQQAAGARRDAAARASRDRVRTELLFATNGYVRPTSGPLTQGYGTHPGIDLAPPYGTPVVAAHAGIVAFVGWQDGYGLHVEVTQPDGYLTTYSHLSAAYAVVGQSVVAATPLGAVGTTGWSTGPHLHFEVMLPGRVRTDPAAWLIAHGVGV